MVGGKVNGCLIFIGPPGAGKGTQAAILCDRLGFGYVATGELLRRHMAEGTSLGRTVQRFVAEGALVPDGIVVDVVTRAIRKLAGRELVVDGYPKTLWQAQVLDGLLAEVGVPRRLVIELVAQPATLLSRLAHRGTEGRRPDDRPEVVVRRLREHGRPPADLIDYYRVRDCHHPVDAERCAAVVSGDVLAIAAQLPEAPLIDG